jgi:hypothetical protein
LFGTFLLNPSDGSNGMKTNIFGWLWFWQIIVFRFHGAKHPLFTLDFRFFQRICLRTPKK